MNEHQPLVSIALCTYNGEKFLKEQLDSILNQTYTNLEVVVTDDVSTDGTKSILEDYAAKDNRVKVFFSHYIRLFSFLCHAPVPPMLLFCAIYTHKSSKTLKNFGIFNTF